MTTTAFQMVIGTQISCHTKRKAALYARLHSSRFSLGIKHGQQFHCFHILQRIESGSFENPNSDAANVLLRSSQTGRNGQIPSDGQSSAVPGANILIEDGVGNNLYSLETLDDGRTPWIALPSNSHLDFRGLQGGDNPDGYADDEYEDSCSDGIDNDGDLLYDTQDDSCDYSIGSREMSKYFVTGYKFGSGYYHYDFLLQEATYEGTVVLENVRLQLASTSRAIPHSREQSQSQVQHGTGNG